ncbi:hypothetical protein ACOME3_006475 [Neoechinorhynchus agilis]
MGSKLSSKFQRKKTEVPTRLSMFDGSVIQNDFQSPNANPSGPPYSKQTSSILTPRLNDFFSSRSPQPGKTSNTRDPTANNLRTVGFSDHVRTAPSITEPSPLLQPYPLPMRPTVLAPAPVRPNLNNEPSQPGVAARSTFSNNFFSPKPSTSSVKSDQMPSTVQRQSIINVPPVRPSLDPKPIPPGEALRSTFGDNFFTSNTLNAEKESVPSTIPNKQSPISRKSGTPHESMQPAEMKPKISNEGAPKTTRRNELGDFVEELSHAKNQDQAKETLERIIKTTGWNLEVCEKPKTKMRFVVLDDWHVPYIKDGRYAERRSGSSMEYEMFLAEGRMQRNTDFYFRDKIRLP